MTTEQTVPRELDKPEVSIEHAKHEFALAMGGFAVLCKLAAASEERAYMLDEFCIAMQSAAWRLVRMWEGHWTARYAAIDASNCARLAAALLPRELEPTE